MLEFDEFINMMSQRDRRKSSSSADTRPTEPEAWRAFKVIINCFFYLRSLSSTN